MKYLSSDIFVSENYYIFNFSDFEGIDSSKFELEIELRYPKTSPCSFELKGDPTIFISEKEHDKGIITFLRNKFTKVDTFVKELDSLKDYFFGCKDVITIDISKKSFEGRWNAYKPFFQNFENDMIKNGYNFEICVYD